MPESPPKPTHSALLFIIFNRPETTAKVFAEIRKARPPRLYIAADGPRPTKPGEELLCQQARAAAGPVDWPCEVKTNFQDTNRGCRDGVVAALDWFFQHEEEGIIIEDDCLPCPDFFRFCDALLERYRHDTRVFHIAGSNQQDGVKHGNASYYFGRISHIWGWATWRRVWQKYCKSLSGFTMEEISCAMNELSDDPQVSAEWKVVAEDQKKGKIDTWDFQYALTVFLNNGLAANPNVNLVSNLGFGNGATHTHNPSNHNASLPVQALDETINHPNCFVPSKSADNYTQSREVVSYRREMENLQKEIAELKAQRYNRRKFKFKRWFARYGGPKKWLAAGL